MTHQKAKKSKKKAFVSPRVTAHGKISKLALTTSQTASADGGAIPYDMMMGICLSRPPAIEEHRLLVNDLSCQDAFKKLISKSVCPGDVVLDLGTGSGIHTFFALQAGARHVYAVDCDTILDFTKQTAASNGLSDKITWIQTDFSRLDLPEKVDVIISNIGFLHSLNEIAPVAKKFLKPGGRLIPDELEISLSPVSVPYYYEQRIQAWDKQKFGIDFSQLKQMAVHHPQYLLLDPKEFISEPQATTKISVGSVSQLEFNWTFKFKAKRSTVMHGLGGFYSFYSKGKEYLSTRPPLKMDKEIWTNFLLPISEPIKLKAGDVITATVSMIRRSPLGQPIWSWSIQAGEHKESYSSFKV